MKDLISVLRAYLDGSIDRPKFSLWFYRFSRLAEKKFYGDDLEFIYLIQGILAESSSGNWGEPGLIEELQEALNGRSTEQTVYEFSWGVPAQMTQAASPRMDLRPLTV
jgi:hypothetical protein